MTTDTHIGAGPKTYCRTAVRTGVPRGNDAGNEYSWGVYLGMKKYDSRKGEQGKVPSFMFS